MKDMKGLTVSEMAEKLGIDSHTVAVRLNRAGIRPISKEALYDESAMEIIRNVQMGRPPKAKPEETAKTVKKPKK
jgi:sulfur carrier protein ThiS